MDKLTLRRLLATTHCQVEKSELCISPTQGIYAFLITLTVNNGFIRSFQ
jgi:hypothetical protein